MQAATDNPRKRLLRRLTQLLFLVGIILVAIPFLSSDDLASKTGSAMDIDVSDMQVGELRSVVWNGSPVFILKRSPEMLEQLRQPVEQLADIWSSRSEQPAAAKNAYRSIRPEYFVSYLGCSSLHCPLKYETGKLVCTCGKSAYDLAGRVFAGSEDNNNLAVPEYFFPEEGLLRLGLSE